MKKQRVQIFCVLVPTNQPFLLSFDYCVNINGGIDNNINEDDDDYFEDLIGDIGNDIDEDDND